MADVIREVDVSMLRVPLIVSPVCTTSIVQIGIPKGATWHESPPFSVGM